MNCNYCRETDLGFGPDDWTPFQEAANVSDEGFGNVTSSGGVYCIRVAVVGQERDAAKIINRYRQSPLYAALQSLGASSDCFFAACGFGDSASAGSEETTMR